MCSHEWRQLDELTLYRKVKGNYNTLTVRDIPFHCIHCLTILWRTIITEVKFLEAEDQQKELEQLKDQVRYQQEALSELDL
jgi:hypothetical protein